MSRGVFIEIQISAQQHVQHKRPAFALIVACTENKPGVFDKRDQGERPDDTADCTNDVFLRRIGFSAKDSELEGSMGDYPVKT
jgi:hypothetical protein